jgi:hypothetical protein
MRWKLLIIATTLASIVSVGGSLGLAYGLLGASPRVRTPDATALAILALPLGIIAAASVFVYRHTARLRALQAAMTAMLSAALTLALFLAGSLLLPERAPEQQAPEPPVRNVD